MKSLVDAIVDFEKWEAEGGIGRFICMVRPDHSCTTAVEQVIKVRELEQVLQKLVNKLMHDLGAGKVTIIAGKDGPDRLEVFRIRK